MPDTKLSLQHQTTFQASVTLVCLLQLLNKFLLAGADE